MHPHDQLSRDTVTGPPPQGRVMELITSLWKTHVAGYELERIINLPGGQNIVLARA